MTSECCRVSPFPPWGVNRVLEATHDFYYERFTREASAREGASDGEVHAARQKPAESSIVIRSWLWQAVSKPTTFKCQRIKKGIIRNCCWQQWVMFWWQVWCLFTSWCRIIWTSVSLQFRPCGCFNVSVFVLFCFALPYFVCSVRKRMPFCKTISLSGFQHFLLK